MKRTTLMVSAFAICVLGFTGCVAEKDITAGGTLAPPNVQFLNVDELKDLFTGNATMWKDLKKGIEGTNIYNADGSYFRLGTWRITDDNRKCNKTFNKERCRKIYMDGDHYVGELDNGKKVFTFIAHKTGTNTLSIVNPSSGKYLSSDEIKELYTGSTTSYTSTKNGYKGQSSYMANGNYTNLQGSWKITGNGQKCQTKNKNNKESCGKVFKQGNEFFLTDKSGKRAKYSFTVKQ